MYASLDYVRRIVPETSTAFITPAAPLFPLSGASIDLWFANNQYYDGGIVADPTGDLSCSRASIGYAKNADGTLTSFGNDTLRIGVGTGLLVEDARMNIKAASEDFSDGSQWNVLKAISVSTNATSAPDGNSTADKLIVDGTTAEHGISGGTITTFAAGAGINSVYIKPAGYNYAIVFIGQGGGGTTYSALFDLVNATVIGTAYTAGTPTGTGATAEQMADGWVRCSVKMDVSAASADFGIDVYNSATYIGLGFAGDGTGGIYVWGAQSENSFPSSYIPTITGSATRAADNITNIGNLAIDIAAALGSIVAQTGNAEGASFAANIVDSNGTNLLGFDATNHGLTSISATLATGNTANRNATADKVGTAWNASGRSLVLNNGTVATDATVQTPSATQYLGSASGTSNFVYCYIKRLTVWTSKLDDATLQGLTAP